MMMQEQNGWQHVGPVELLLQPAQMRRHRAVIVSLHRCIKTHQTQTTNLQNSMQRAITGIVSPCLITPYRAHKATIV